MEPPWLVLDTTRLRPALDIDTDPVDRVRSAEHAHVVPDVPRRPRRAVCEARGWGETPCQRHVSPRNPIRFETTVDTPAPAAISPQAATSRAGLNPGRHHVRANVDITGTIASRTARRLVRGTTVGTPFSRGRAAGDRRVGRQSPPPAPSKSPTPFTPCWAHWRGGPGHRMEKVTGRSHQEG